MRLILSFVCVMSGLATRQTNDEVYRADIDFKSFIALSAEVEACRKDRLVSKQTFLEMADDPDTIILDTRSRESVRPGILTGPLA